VKKEQTRRTDERVSIEPTKPSAENHSGKINDDIRDQAEHELFGSQSIRALRSKNTAAHGGDAEEYGRVMAPPRHSVKKQESSWPEYIKGEGDLAIYPTSPAKSFPLFGAPK
jgi:hypothetical protein